MKGFGWAGRPLGLAGFVVPLLVVGDEPTSVERWIITGRRDSLLEIADAASEGYVGRDHFERRPLQRPGELIEAVPGMIATQHSGAGKANQYFLRGFNLDHGTDFATSVDGVPVNLPTHGHGQGYTDLNFLIPELVETIHFRKGPSYAEVGDFGSAGAADLEYANRLERGQWQVEGGSFGYGRGFFAASPKVGEGHLLYAAEVAHDDGPWENPSDFQKVNAVMRYSREEAEGGMAVTAMAYAGRWEATDQIPLRAVEGGRLDRFAGLDNSDGGDSKRFSLSGRWHRESDGGHSELQVYGVYYDLNLYSNFTYFLDDPVNGDQFQQLDERGLGGLKAHRTWDWDVSGVEASSTIGFQLRGDRIENGLNRTVERRFLETTRADTVGQVSLAPWLEQKVRWTDWVRTTAGLRADWYGFDVESDRAVNSGTASDFLVSPKGSVVFGPWRDTELYLSGGLGFHSNDGRGVTTREDPVSGDPVDGVDALVRTHGAEVGLRTVALPGLQSTVSYWWLDLDSELLFIGDAGTTEATRPSRRHGVEFANYYNPTSWLTLDADVSWSQARFRDSDPAGRFIPGSIERVVAAGVVLHDMAALKGFFVGVRLREFGSRPLVEDGSVRSGETLLLNAQAGYRFNTNWMVTLDVFNLLDRRDDDITYFYESRLAGEAAPVSDLHFHPVEPIRFRVALKGVF